MENTQNKSERFSLSVIIPAFQEEEGISGVLAGLGQVLDRCKHLIADYEIIVIDDGSTDRTADLAEKAGARVIRHPSNRGYGRALLTGFSVARFPWILMIDADGTYPTEEMAGLLACAPGFDMVVGARQGPVFWGDTVHSFLRWTYLSLSSFIAGEDIPDANSGLRLIRKEALDKSMPVLCYGYSMTTTMTLSFIQGGRFVKFVPISYAERKGSSKVRHLRDILRTLQIMTQTILYYNSLKFAVCLALVPAGFSLIFLAEFIQRPRFAPFAMLCVCVLAEIGIFLFGCLIDFLRLNRIRSGLL